jgi:hypothetical protein
MLSPSKELKIQVGNHLRPIQLLWQPKQKRTKLFVIDVVEKTFVFVPTDFFQYSSKLEKGMMGLNAYSQMVDQQQECLRD